MVNLIASPNRVLQFGYEGEDNVTQIIFNYDESWLSYGDGEFKVRVLRPGDKEAYNATDVVDNRSLMTLVMTVTDIELSRKGRGELQLVYICHDVVKKSEIYTFVVRRAIDSEVVNPPKGGIIAEVEESLAEIEDYIGDLSELTTTNKDSLVEAINEVNAKEGGSITVDDELSGVSENPVQNKVVKARFDGLDQTVAGIGGRLATAETALEGKANTSDVNTALAGKANTADMNTALAGKASTDVATQSANGLMSSADKTKLDGLGFNYKEIGTLVLDEDKNIWDANFGTDYTKVIFVANFLASAQNNSEKDANFEVLDSYGRIASGIRGTSKYACRISGSIGNVIYICEFEPLMKLIQIKVGNGGNVWSHNLGMSAYNITGISGVHIYCPSGFYIAAGSQITMYAVE